MYICDKPPTRQHVLVVIVSCVCSQDMKQHIVLVMELCEYDLDYLVKLSPFREDDITLFLFQLGGYPSLPPSLPLSAKPISICSLY